jgi:catechol 2,3-dioxygenase-like lactoylglutathione lyase family enzyme
VALVVTDVEATARTFMRDLDLPRVDVDTGLAGRRVPAFPVGQSAIALLAPDDPLVGGEARPGVHHIVLEAPDLAAAASRVTAAGIRVADGAAAGGAGGRRRVLLDPATTGAVRVHLSEPLALGGASTGQVERIDHLGVACADGEAALRVFSGQLGFPVESIQTDVETQVAIESFTSDRHGVVYHTRAPEVTGALRVTFVTIGDCDLEFLQDVLPSAGTAGAAPGAGTTRRDRGAIARFVASRGPGLHHLALKVRDIQATLDRLARAGHELIDRVGRPGSRRARIAFLHPRALGGVLLHLVERSG